MMPKTTCSKKKTVSFSAEKSDNSNNKIHYIDSSLSLVGEGNKSQLWFTPIELRRIQIRAFKLSHDLKTNAFNKKLLEIKHNGDITSRGLEFYSNLEFQQAARLRRSKSRNAVVTWSKTQTSKYENESSMSSQKQRIRDEFVISHTYSSICQDAVQYAINQAQKDRNFVLQNEIDELVMMKTTTTQKTTVSQEEEEETTNTSSSSSSSRKRKSTMVDNDCYSSKMNNMIRPPQKQVFFHKRQFAAVAC